MKIDLHDIYPRVKQQFNMRLKSQLALVFDYSCYEVSLFNGDGCSLKELGTKKPL